MSNSLVTLFDIINQTHVLIYFILFRPRLTGRGIEIFTNRSVHR